MNRTLKQLRQSIDLMISELGEDAPVAAWIFNAEDVKYQFNPNDNKDYEIPQDKAEEVIAALDDYDCVYTEIYECIDNELRERGLIDL